MRSMVEGAATAAPFDLPPPPPSTLRSCSAAAAEDGSAVPLPRRFAPGEELAVRRAEPWIEANRETFDGWLEEARAADEG